MRRLALLLATALVACSDRSSPSTPTAPPVQVNAAAAAIAPSVRLVADDPQTCAPCHATVVAEWLESQHAHAHHDADPLYAAMRALRTQKQGAHIPSVCARCHTPRDLEQHDSAAAKTGVACAACHQLDRVHLDGDRKGTDALVRGPELLFRGSHDLPDGVSPVHRNGPAHPALVDGTTLCRACHEEERNAAGVPTCSTGIEHGTTADRASCTSCHMELVPGPSGVVSQRPEHRSHRFRGAMHALRSGDLSFLASGVALSGRFDGDRVLVAIENRTQHAFPTGFPGRVAVLVVRALDADGKELFRNVTKNPAQEHPEAVFGKAYVDADGKPALAPFAAKLARDSRLMPGERREVGIAVPSGTVRVEAHVRFVLAAEGMVKALTYQGPETQPLELPPVQITR